MTSLSCVNVGSGKSLFSTKLLPEPMWLIANLNYNEKKNAFETILGKWRPFCADLDVLNQRWKGFYCIVVVE